MCDFMGYSCLDALRIFDVGSFNKMDNLKTYLRNFGVHRTNLTVTGNFFAGKF